MEAPGPVCRILYRLRGQLGLEGHQQGAGPGQADQGESENKEKLNGKNHFLSGEDRGYEGKCLQTPQNFSNNNSFWRLAAN